ncbi:MAG: cytochrome c biogenesis protein CcsA [Paludibacteraceae bacterium]
MLLALALLIIIALCSYSSWNRMSVCRHPMTATVLLLVFAIVNAIEGTWALGLQHSWAMYSVVLLLLFSLGLAVAHKLQKTASKALCLPTRKERVQLWLRKMPFLLLHTGIFLVLFGGFFGTPDREDGQVLLEYGVPTHIAYQSNGEMLPLPFEMQIDTFYIDYYADGRSPKQFTTRFTISEIGKTLDEGLRTQDERQNSNDSENSETNVTSSSSFILHPSSKLTTAVNHPCSYRGYHFYQSNYDPVRGEYSVLKVVRDPWIAVVWIGVALLAIGACWQTTRQWKAHWGWWLAVGIVTIAFTVITLAKINFGTLMPALRSAWFIPHIGVYMIAYSLLAVASILGVVMLANLRMNKLDDVKMHYLLMGLLQTSSCLLLMGMLCGAVWAKQAWGDYWTWDPKECWALATWMLTLIGMHLKTKSQDPKDKKTIQVLLVVFVLLSFAAMQMTWYGVNYLPSAEVSLHTYGR